MHFDIIQNFWLGFIITASPGAVLLEAIRRSLSPNTNLLPFLVGNFIGMITVILLAFMGVSVLQHSVTGTVFYIVSGSVLLYIGGATALTTTTRSRKRSDNSATVIGALALGTLLALANPLSFIFWVSVIGKMQTHNSTVETILQTLAIVSGSVAVYVFIAVSRTYSALFYKRYRVVLSRVLGITIALYGLLILSKVIVHSIL